jgi:hypothetical protein
MEGSQRRVLRWLTLLAMLAVAVQAVTGANEVSLYAMPLLLIVGLLVSGRFIGEERILERWRRSAPCHAVRRVRVRWRGVPERPLVSLRERSAPIERGPPALAVHRA